MKRGPSYFRIASIFVPSAIAWNIAFMQRDVPGLARVVLFGLGPLWVLVSLGLLVRGATIGARGVDLLTGRGAALAWLSGAMLALAVTFGYASLALVAMLASVLFHLVFLVALVALRGRDPMRSSVIARKFTPEIATEGAEVVEELRFDGANVPVGFRMFVTGRVGPRWATCRHVVNTEDSGAEVSLESEIGPAVRGEHDPEPLVCWLEDIFGLCRSPDAEIAGSRLTVLPRPRKVDQVPMLLGHGLGPRKSRQGRLPTEGYFDLREYKPGDDIRRIHWVRSQARGELVVRLPDEIPPDRPRVRLVLDTFFPEALALDCAAPGEMLDALVATWLAAGRSLVESGARVTLVTALAKGGAISAHRHELTVRAMNDALRLGARVAWQNKIPTEALLTEEATFVVSRGVLAVPPAAGNVRWILARPAFDDPGWPFPAETRLAYTMGSAENRWSHRREVVAKHALERSEHAHAVVTMRASVAHPPPGSLAAFPGAQAIRLEAIS